MKIASIASGSSGNCIYVGSGRYHILIDAGISLRRIEAGLNQLGLTAADIDAVLITHEHSDHVNGLGPLLKKHHTPVFATAGTVNALSRMAALSAVEEEIYHYVTPGQTFRLGDFDITPVRISHDAAEPVMYRLGCGNCCAAVATDIGVVTEPLIDALTGLDALFLESNHDVRMLQVGPYPYYLKQRILSDSGHLSNENAGQLLARLCSPRLKTVVLSHLSKTNNYRDLALESVRLELSTAGIEPQPRLITAPETELSEVVEV